MERGFLASISKILCLMLSYGKNKQVNNLRSFCITLYQTHMIEVTGVPNGPQFTKLEWKISS